MERREEGGEVGDGRERGDERGGGGWEQEEGAGKGRGRERAERSQIQQFQNKPLKWVKPKIQLAR